MSDSEPRPSPQDTATDEPRWHAAIAVVVVLFLYVTLPDDLRIGPTFLAPLIVLGILLPLLIFAPTRRKETKGQRVASIALIAATNIFNVASVVLLIYFTMFSPVHKGTFSGTHLLLAGAEIWLANLLVYALWYWEVDGGGPNPRARAVSAVKFTSADFLFPQMLVGNEHLICIEKTWKPLFIDYVFLAFNTALAFSPTDTFPISRRGKLLMMFEALASFVTIAIVLARAVGMV